MSASSHSARFVSDRRGNRLVDWHIDQGSGKLSLRGSEEMCKQVVACWPRAHRLNLLERPPYWTHRIHMDFPEPPELQDLLRLLSEVLTLHVASTVVVDTAIALDFYNKPDADELEYTDTGQLLHSLKYGRHAPDETARLGRKLCAALCDVVNRHPLFRDVTRLLPVPGSTRRLSDRIGSTLHRDLGIPLTHVTRRSVASRPAKDMTSRERAERINDFTIDEGLTGERVLIVDDLYRTGRTLAEVARVAHSAGADAVYGLVAARTLGSRDKPPTSYRWQPR